MIRLLVLLIMLINCPCIYGQDYKKHRVKTRHTDEVISIATSDSVFATSSYDNSVIVWDYSGKVIYTHKVPDGNINSLFFLPNSQSLLIGVTEVNGGKIHRHVIRCLNSSGEIEYELIDKRLTQEYVNISFEKNVKSVRNAIGSVAAAFPELDIKKDLEVPQISREISHIELVQSIAVSPDSKTIASIDGFNILKTWDRNQKVKNSFKILNNKKDTRIYFRSDSIIFIEPNIILNIKDSSAQIINGFERYSGIPFGSGVYFHFNYNNESRPEKLYNLNNANVKIYDSKNYYTASAASSNEKLVLLGVDGLIRVLNTSGELISKFGKDKNEVITFRGENINLFSNACSVGISPDGKFIISGYENGVVTIWALK